MIAPTQSKVLTPNAEGARKPQIELPADADGAFAGFVDGLANTSSKLAVAHAAGVADLVAPIQMRAAPADAEPAQRVMPKKEADEMEPPTISEVQNSVALVEEQPQPPLFVAFPLVQVPLTGHGPLDGIPLIAAEVSNVSLRDEGQLQQTVRALTAPASSEVFASASRLRKANCGHRTWGGGGAVRDSRR